MEFHATTERFVAYFDIMGFKDLIYRSDHSDVADIMSRVSTIVATLKKIEKESLNLDENQITESPPKY